VLETIALAKPQMRTGETVLEAMERVWGELAAAQCELMQLRAAALPLPLRTLTRAVLVSDHICQRRGSWAGRKTVSTG
jgi:hypothetical protein